MINHLLRLRQDREDRQTTARGEIHTPATADMGASTARDPTPSPSSSPSPTVTITTTVTTPARNPTQNTVATQCVVVPLSYQTPVKLPVRQPVTNMSQASQVLPPGTAVAERKHTNGWYCVARGREVGVVHDWCVDNFSNFTSHKVPVFTPYSDLRWNVQPLVSGVVRWDAKRWSTRERAQQAYDEKLARGEVEKVGN